MHHDLHQYVCMSVERDDQGKVTEILFEQNDGSFGSFNGAAVSKDVTPKEPWTDAVSLDYLVDRLWRLIGSRAELTVIPDFRGFDSDRNGVPKLFRHDLQCESCRNEWSEKSAQASLTHTCPRCKSIVHTDTGSVRWIGPSHAILQALWGRLTYPVGAPLKMPGGLAITQTPKSMILHDDRGGRVECVRNRDGMRLSVLKQTGEPHVLVNVHGKRTTVDFPNDRWRTRF